MSQLSSFVDAEVSYHQQSLDILLALQDVLKRKYVHGPLSTSYTGWAKKTEIEIAQRIFKYSDIQYSSLTPNKIMKSLIYRTLFYVNIYGSYKLSINSPVFLAYPVYCNQ